METPSLNPVGMAMLPFDVIVLIACIHPHVYAVLRQLCKRFRNIIDKRLSRESAANLFAIVETECPPCSRHSHVKYTQSVLPNGHLHGDSYYTQTSSRPLKYMDCRDIIKVEEVRTYSFGTHLTSNVNIVFKNHESQTNEIDHANDTRVVKKYRVDGKIAAEIHFLHKDLHGPLKTWNEGGSMVEENYVNGRRCGTVRIWNVDGNLGRETNVAGDWPKGLETVYYPNGKPYIIRNFVLNSNCQMPFVEWEEHYHQNGQLMWWFRNNILRPP